MNRPAFTPASVSASILALFLIAVLAPAVPASMWSFMYRGAPLYDVGSWPDSTYMVSGAADIAAGDLNGDGRPDLVTANSHGPLTPWTGTSVSVLLHSKLPALDPFFEKKKNFVVPTGPRNIELADMNKDGKLDIVVANVTSGVSILLGNGSGGFAAHVDYATPALTGGLGIADFNDDGRLDVVVGAGTNVAILLGAVGGTLGAATTYPSGIAAVTELRAGDATGDGLADVAVVAGTTAPTVAVLIGNGAGALTGVAGPYTVGTFNATDVAIADLNADAKPDLVVAVPGDESFAVLLGTGGNAFAPRVLHDAGNLHD